MADLSGVSLTTDALANLCEAELLVSWSVEGFFKYLVNWHWQGGQHLKSPFPILPQNTMDSV